MSNRLAHETSPYLLQHAENPVDWYPWGEEALARAEREDKPIFLSIGYAACHWCHVMEHESFEDETVAALLNRHFVSIKVDREERPDLDDIYMAATMALSGSGGWPMSVFLAPDRCPFFAGTYFPPHHGQGRIGFSTLLKRIVDLWQNQRDDLLAQANALASQVRAGYEIAAADPVSSAAMSAAVRSLATNFDPEWGGFGRACSNRRRRSSGPVLSFSIPSMSEPGRACHIATRTPSNSASQWTGRVDSHTRDSCDSSAPLPITSDTEQGSKNLRASCRRWRNWSAHRS
jgi:uncharacterized protein YyaL (SSP411 family)